MLTQQRAILLALSLGFLTVTLDTSALTVALPAIRDSFDGTLANLQWVSNGYVLAFAGCILSAGRFADRFGPRTMFSIGVMGLAASSLLCALAPQLEVLILARVLQGIAGAVLTTSSYALLAHTFPTGPERAKAFASLNFSGSVGLSLGPLIGGLLIGMVGWRSIFVLNIVVAAILFTTLRVIDNQHDSDVLTLDLPGQVLSVLMLTGLATTLIEGRSEGWTGFPAIFAVVTAATFVAFLVVEKRSPHPMLPLDLFRNGAFSAGTTIIGLWRGSLYGLMFFLALYFQNVNGYSSFTTGLAFLPVSVGPLLPNALSARWINKFGASSVAITGMTVAAVGGVLFFFAGSHPHYIIIATGLLFMGAGAGAGIPAIGNLALSTIPKSHVGVASGVFNAGGQTGILIGIAIIGSYAGQQTGSGLHAAATVVVLGLFTILVLCRRSIRAAV